jgi:flavin reductase (DIM6/NTAB) family NADH-FMN oxidoreductase RutF
MVSGKTVDKFAETGLTPEPATKVKAPLIKECPVNIECLVKKQVPLGAHRLFLGEIVQVHVAQDILDESGKIDFNKAVPFVYNGARATLHATCCSSVYVFLLDVRDEYLSLSRVFLAFKF